MRAGALVAPWPYLLYGALIFWNDSNMSEGGRRRKTLKKNMLWPLRYYSGLTRKQALERKAEIRKFGKMHWRDPRAYVGFKTDRYGKTKRRSSYTVQWDKLFPDAKSLEERSKATGVPVKYLKKVWARAISAWRTGHRMSQTPQSWAYPRVSSYLLCGKTYYTADSDLVRQAKRESASARKWFRRCKTSKLTRV
jgi:hypothetical protein